MIHTSFTKGICLNCRWGSQLDEKLQYYQTKQRNIPSLLEDGTHPPLGALGQRILPKPPGNSANRLLQTQMHHPTQLRDHIYLGCRLEHFNPAAPCNPLNPDPHLVAVCKHPKRSQINWLCINWLSTHYFDQCTRTCSITGPAHSCSITRPTAE